MPTGDLPPVRWTDWSGYYGLQPKGNNVPTQRYRPKAAKSPPTEVRSMSMTTAQLYEKLTTLVIGQNKALEAIIPYIVAHTAGLASPTRPVACMLLLGPTGSGKTKTAEALAEVLHGDEKKLIRIDCGQFALQHEVAKLIGAPPGYLGHRETSPLLTQKKLDNVTTEGCPISIVLFDEIEKAHPSIFQMLLSVTDKGSLTLGDNTSVTFNNSLLFFTSNLGAREMQRTIMPDLGFAPAQTSVNKLDKIGMVAVRKKFTPEFINRLDEVIVYEPLGTLAIHEIFTLAIDKVRGNIFSKYGVNSFLLIFTEECSEALIKEGFSDRYGARELGRVIFRRVTKLLSNKLVDSGIAAGAVVRLYLKSDEILLEILDPETIKKLAKKT